MTTVRSSVNTHQYDAGDAATEKENTELLLAAIVQEQLTTLESLTAEGRAQLDTLQSEVADLTARIQNTQTQLASLSALLLANERILAALRAGIAALPSMVSPEESVAAHQTASDRSQPIVTAAERPIAHDAIQESNVSSAQRAAVISNESHLPSKHTDKPTAESADHPTADPKTLPPTAIPVEPAAAPPAAAPSTATTPPAATPATQETPSQGAPDPTSPSEVTAETATSPEARPKPAPYSGSGEIVQRGSMVEVIFDDDTIETYTIVRSTDANPMQNLIADNSPLGSALLGARTGEVRHFRIRSGPERIVRVRAII